MFWILLFTLFTVFPANTNPVNGEVLVKDDILVKVNEIRKNGCYCGRRYMAPAQPVKWNETLYTSALQHAMDMSRNNFFAHFSSDGLNIGDRLEKHGYDWQVVGENLGEGQVSFEEVLKDWLKSYSHCIMVMNPKVDEMAVAKYQKYWVQHFGKKMKR